jgi:hypothetical protein
MDMVPVYSPRTESEAAVVTALMQAYGVVFFMRGGAFSTMYPGPALSSLNEQMLMVEAGQADMARDLLANFVRQEHAG